MNQGIIITGWDGYVKLRNFRYKLLRKLLFAPGLCIDLARIYNVCSTTLFIVKAISYLIIYFSNEKVMPVLKWKHQWTLDNLRQY